MKRPIIKGLGALGTAVAFSLLCLVNAGGAASASPVSAHAGHAVPVGPISPPRDFRPAAAQHLPPGEPRTDLDHLQRAGYQRGSHAGFAGVHEPGSRLLRDRESRIR